MPKDFLLYKETKEESARNLNDPLDPSLSYSELSRMAKAKGEDFLRKALVARLELHQGNLSSLSSSLNCDRSNLRHLLKQLGLDHNNWKRE